MNIYKSRRILFFKEQDSTLFFWDNWDNRAIAFTCNYAGKKYWWNIKLPWVPLVYIYMKSMFCNTTYEYELRKLWKNKLIESKNNYLKKKIRYEKRIIVLMFRKMGDIKL